MMKCLNPMQFCNCGKNIWTSRRPMKEIALKALKTIQKLKTQYFFYQIFIFHQMTVLQKI